jgi:tetrapyrrole methylase family protein / MazG family protein
LKKDLHSSQTVTFEQLRETIAALRDPKSGCPWDLAQSHKSLRKYMIEEAYEAIEVMDPLIPDQFLDELGDVLLQVVLNSQMAAEVGLFSIDDVIRNLDEKMKRRHPHVFDKKSESSVLTSETVQTNWIKIKAQEKQKIGQREGLFSNIKKSKETPASVLAIKIGEVASTINFDWVSASAVFKQLENEIYELKTEIEANPNSENSYEELGDVYFTLAQLARHMKVSPEVCAFDSNTKFLRRFRHLERIATKKNIDIKFCTSNELEGLWQEVKRDEKIEKEKLSEFK